MRCRHFGPPDHCGGCTRQHIAYPDQLRLKTELVDRLVRAAVPDAPATRPTMPSTPLDDPWGYRHRVHFVFGQRKPNRVCATGEGGSTAAPLLMGHYVRGTRRVFDAKECPVHDPRGNAIAFSFARTFEKERIEAAAGGRGVLRGIVVRVGARTGETMATLVVANDGDRRLRAATRRAMQEGEAPSSLHLNLHPKGDAFIFGRDTRRISGPERMRESVADTSFLISSTAFFQTNVPTAEILVNLVLQEVPAGARVLDLYAGAGLFAVPLARAGHDVTAIEEHRPAVSDGEATLRLNTLTTDRCRFIAKRVETALTSVRTGSVDAVVLDPPREGCTASVLDEVFGRLRPARAIYVSCNPEALARDLAIAARLRYVIRSLQPVDMFPHTDHIETVAVLTR